MKNLLIICIVWKNEIQLCFRGDLMKRYVIFDIDGTLNRTDLYAVEAYQKALATRNWNIGREEIISCIGLSPSAIVNRLFGSLENDELETWRRDIREYESILMKDRARPFDGVGQTLAALKQAGYGLAICSNAFAGHIESVLTAIGLCQYFDTIGSLDLGADKIEVIRKLSHHTGWDKACMVGDRIFDIQAARANGIPFIGCEYGYAPEEIQDADVVVREAAEIYGAVETLI